MTEKAVPAVAVLGALTVKWVAAAGVDGDAVGAGDARFDVSVARDRLGAGGHEGHAVGEGVDAVVAAENV